MLWIWYGIEVLSWFYEREKESERNINVRLDIYLQAAVY